MPNANPEAALEEFERMAAAADVNIDSTSMDEEEAEDLEDVRRLFTGAIEDGRLAVDEEGRAVLQTEDGPITFRPPVGRDLMIMASSKDDRRMEAMARFVCSITGQSHARVNSLKKNEWKLAMRIAGFLSAD